jgi:hypothetical protein
VNLFRRECETQSSLPIFPVKEKRRDHQKIWFSKRNHESEDFFGGFGALFAI